MAQALNNSFKNLCYTGGALIIQQHWQAVLVFQRIRLGIFFTENDVANLSWKPLPDFSSQETWVPDPTFVLNIQEPHTNACWKSGPKSLKLYYGENTNLTARLESPGKDPLKIPPERVYIQWGEIYQELTPYLLKSANGEYSLYLFHSTENMMVCTHGSTSQENPHNVVQHLQHFFQSDYAKRNYSPDSAERLQQCRNAVCRIVTPDADTGTGTGFVIGNRLLLTNNHILKDKKMCEESRAEFFYDSPNTGGIPIKFDPKTFFASSGVGESLTPETLDFTIVALEDDPRLEKVFAHPIALDKIDSEGIGPGKGVTVIHHPRGKPKKVCLPESHNNRITKVELLHFVHTAPLDPGSSGSPVLSASMQLVGLHCEKRGWNPMEKVAIKAEAIRFYLQNHPQPNASHWTKIINDFQPRQLSTDTVAPSQKPGTQIQPAVLKNIYQQDPYIPRFSGDSLLLENSYINLQIVKEEEQKKKEEKLRQGPESEIGQKEKTSSSHTHHLNTFEEIYAAKEPIAIEKLFERQKDEKLPLKRLVLGKAGIGKSTFCKYAAYRWSKGELWNDLFDWVFWIPLRELNDKKDSDLMDFIYQKWFKSSKSKKVFDKFWREEIVISQKVLFLLDGYDELSSDIPISELLINYTSSHVLITSRPYSTSDLRGYQKLEITGFTDENIEQFISHCYTKKTPVTPTNTDHLTSTTTSTTSITTTTTTTSTTSATTSSSQKESLLHFLHQNPAIYGIAHSPIQLDLICSFWQDKMPRETTSVSMTTLYHDLEISLLKRHFKEELRVEEVTDIEIEDKGQPLIDFLSQLAYLAMKQEALIIPNTLVNEAVEAFKKKEGFLQKALHMGLLKKFDKLEYYFVHLTFQEYYAARHLVTLLKNPQNKKEADRFIRKEKYNRRMQFVFWFAAGICRLEDNRSSSSPSSSKTFSLTNQLFQSILADPQDLLGVYDAQLAVRLLEEAGLPETEEGQKLQEKVQHWIIPHSKNGYDDKDHPFYLLAPFLILSPSYTKQYGIPAYLEKLQKGTPQDKINSCLALRGLPVPGDQVKEVVGALVPLLKDPAADVKKAACWALRGLPVPGDQVKKVVGALVPLLKDLAADVKKAACRALRGLPVSGKELKEVVGALAPLLKDSDEDIEEAACAALRGLQVPGDPVQEIVRVLVKLLKDPAADVKEAACWALRELQVSGEPVKEVVGVLVPLLKDPAADVKMAACWALRGLQLLGEEVKEVVGALVELLKDPDWKIRVAACGALNDLQLPVKEVENVVSALIPLLKDPTSHIEEAACAALRGLLASDHAMKTVVGALVELLKDPDWRIKVAACRVLRGLPVSDDAMKTVVDALVELLKDPAAEVKVAACRVLRGLPVSDDAMKTVVDALVELLKDPAAEVKVSACRALRALPVSDDAMKTVVDALVELLKDPAAEVKVSACRALRALPVSDDAMKTVVDALVELLKDPAAEVKVAACRELRALPVSDDAMKTVVDALVKLLKDPAAEVKVAACAVLEVLPMLVDAVKTVMDVLILLLKDPAVEVKVAACRALRALPVSDDAMKTVVDALVELLKDPAAEVKVAACAVLEVLPMLADAVKTVMDVLILLLADPAAEAKVAGCRALGGLPVVSGEEMKKVMGALVRLLKDPNPEVKRTARAVLEGLPVPVDTVKTVVDVLIPLLKDPDAKVKGTACAVLEGLPVPVDAVKTVVDVLIPLIKDPDAEVRRLIFKYLSQMDSSQFALLFKHFTPKKFIEKGIRTGLNLLDFTTYCFKHQLFEKNYLEVMIRLALREQTTLYLDQGQLHLYHRRGQQSFPVKGQCSDFCWEKLEGLKQERDKLLGNHETQQSAWPNISEKTDKKGRTSISRPTNSQKKTSKNIFQGLEDINSGLGMLSALKIVVPELLSTTNSSEFSSTSKRMIYEKKDYSQSEDHINDAAS